MSGEDMASNYSFGEYDDFSEYDIMPDNDNDSVSLYGGSGAIPKSNILVLSDIEESFVVLGRDILKSIREYSNDESPEPTPSLDSEENSESATSSPQEILLFQDQGTKILAQSEDVGDFLSNTKKPTSNLKDVTEKFRSTSSPLLCNSNTAYPSNNEAFFHSTATNYAKIADTATERQNKLLKEIKQILQQKGRYDLEEEVQKVGHQSEEVMQNARRESKERREKVQNARRESKERREEVQNARRESNKEMQKPKIKEDLEYIAAVKEKVSSIMDNLTRKLNDGAKVTNRLEHQDLYVPSKMKLKNNIEIFDCAEELCVSSLAKNESKRSDFKSYKNSEPLKTAELKKIIDESLMDELSIDNRSKQLLLNFKNSIEIFENSCSDDNSKDIGFNANENGFNGNECNELYEYKGLAKKNAKALNYAILINCVICFVFMVFMYFWGVILIDVVKMSDKIMDAAGKIEKFNNDPFNYYYFPRT